jgi:hypothetical protein
MSPRERLPNRRASTTFEFEHHGLSFVCSYSNYGDGRLAAVFLASNKSGSQADANARDSALFASLALQYGCSLKELHHAALRNADDSASTPLGAALDLIAKDDTMKSAEMHSPFGGSVAARVLHCPASVRLVEKVPAHLRKTSIYAERGTALHAAMALLLDDNAPSVDSLRGKTINNYTITDDDTELALRPMLAYVVALLDTPGANFFLERRVIFPAIANTFGTCDLIIRIGTTMYVVDFKFGVGVPVRALYPDGDEDVINAQLLFYAAAARHSHLEFFAGVDEIVLTILQAQSIELDADMVSSVAVTHAEIDEFVAVYRGACAEALAPTPRLERGDWCRFCAARPICPAHTGPLLDLTQFAVPTPGAAVSGVPAKDVYLQLLADGLNLVDAIKNIRTALHDQAKRALENGDVVPGYTLTAGRAERVWRDDERTAIAALESLGLTRDDIVTATIRSPKQVEIRAKARGLKVPSEFIVSTRSGTSLARVENAHALTPGRSELVRKFSAALETFLGEEIHG